MVNTLRASKEGLELVSSAISRKGWKRQASYPWWEKAFTSRATVKRFWRRIKIDCDAFKNICCVAGVDWEQVAEINEVQDIISEEESTNSLDITQSIPEKTSVSPMPAGDEIIYWVGREDTIAQLLESLKRNCRILSIVGITGIGKTSLAGKLTCESEVKQSWCKEKSIFFDRKPPTFNTIVRQILGEQAARNEKLQQEDKNSNNSDFLDKLLVQVVLELQEHPYLIVLDMLEVALEPDGEGGYQFADPMLAKFLEQFLKVQSMPSRIIVTSQYQFPAIAEGRYQSRIYETHLMGLSESESLELFQQWEIEARGKSALDYLKRIIAVYEGHPLALRVIAGDIKRDYKSDIQAYWHEFCHEFEAIEQMQRENEIRSHEDISNLHSYNSKLKNLVKQRIESTFQRLRQSYPIAYRLLCSGSVYRRAVERKGWLIELLGYSPQEQIKAWQALEQSFLLERELIKHKCLYRLHNLIRGVALEHLRNFEKETL